MASEMPVITLCFTKAEHDRVFKAKGEAADRLKEQYQAADVVLVIARKGFDVVKDRNGAPRHISVQEGRNLLLKVDPYA